MTCEPKQPFIVRETRGEFLSAGNWGRIVGGQFRVHIIICEILILFFSKCKILVPNTAIDVNSEPYKS